MTKTNYCRLGWQSNGSQYLIETLTNKEENLYLSFTSDPPENLIEEFIEILERNNYDADKKEVSDFIGYYYVAFSTDADDLGWNIELENRFKEYDVDDYTRFVCFGINGDGFVKVEECEEDAERFKKELLEDDEVLERELCVLDKDEMIERFSDFENDEWK